MNAAITPDLQISVTTKTTTVPSTSDDYTSHDLWPFGSGELKTRNIDFVILINILKYLRILHVPPYYF
jgi:hypothetical protein